MLVVDDVYVFVCLILIVVVILQVGENGGVVGEDGGVVEPV